LLEKGANAFLCTFIPSLTLSKWHVAQAVSCEVMFISRKALIPQWISSLKSIKDDLSTAITTWKTKKNKRVNLKCLDYVKSLDDTNMCLISYPLLCKVIWLYSCLSVYPLFECFETMYSFQTFVVCETHEWFRVIWDHHNHEPHVQQCKGKLTKNKHTKTVYNISVKTKENTIVYI